MTWLTSYSSPTRVFRSLPRTWHDRPSRVRRVGASCAGAEFGGVEFYPDLARKTAVLASRLIGNHPLPDGNKRVGYLCSLEFVVRKGGTWTHPHDDLEGDATVAMIDGFAAGAIDEDGFTVWIAQRLE